MAAEKVAKYLEVAGRIEGELVPGLTAEARVPSARDVAGMFAVSVVTASRALQVLRDKGLIRMVDRSGSFLTTPAVASTER